MRKEWTAEQNIQDGWDFVFNRLFNKKTKLIYDYVTEEGENGAWAHLPTKEEIKNNYPNPCGWYTGMEDSDINGGMMMDAVIYRYNATKDPSMKKYADDLYEGLMQNTRVSEQKGFLARGRLPEDGVTHYINSSRDQYTHWIFAMLHFYHSELSNAEQRESIKTALIEMAEKAERDVIEENDYCLLNEEGKPALVCEMANENVVWHESLRMAMFFMAAYVVTNDGRWLEAYKKWREWGLDYAEEIQLTKERYTGAFMLMQMQLSVKLLYDYEQETSYKERYGKLMEKVGEFSKFYVFESLEYLKDFEMPTTLPSWRDCPKKYVRKSNIYGYKVILNNIYEAKKEGAARALRNGSESLVVQLLGPDDKIDQEQIAAFTKIVKTVSFKSPYNHIPVAYCLAWWMLKN